MMNFLTEGLGQLATKIRFSLVTIGSEIEVASPFDNLCSADDSIGEVCRIPISVYKISPQRGGIRNDYTAERESKINMIKYGADVQLIKEAEEINYDDEVYKFDDIYDKAVRANASTFLNTAASEIYDEVMDVVNHMSSSAKRDFEYVTACIQVAVNKTSAVGKFSEKRKKELIDDIEEIKKHLGESEYKPYVEILLNQSKSLISKIEDLILKQNVDSQEPEEDTSAKATDKNDAD